MGNWQLEVWKFSMYVFAPVVSFWVYHKVDFFKDDLIKFERKVQTPEILQNEQKIKDDLELLNRLKEISLKKRLESQAAASVSKE